MKFITLSLYVKTVREHSKNRRKSFQNILASLFDLILEDPSYSVESTTSSRIMTGEYDVPYLIREKYNEKDETDRIAISNDFINRMIDESSMDGLLCEVKSLISESKISAKTKETIMNEKDDQKILSSFLSIAIIADNRKIIDETLYKKGNGVIRLIAGDIIAIGFNKKIATTERIVAIPVDDKFTMILNDQNGEAIISKDTIHGKWLLRMNKTGFFPPAISYIKTSDTNQIGKCRVGKTEFYLLPVSSLKERHKAESSPKMVHDSINALVHEYNVSGQGTPLYVPLIGTGRSRANLSTKESINLIKNAFINSNEGFFGNIEIVLDQKLIDEYRELQCQGE